MTTEPDLLTVKAIRVGNFDNPIVRVYPLVDHIADKLCATQARYGEYSSSRVKDLVDLVVFARTSSLDGTDLMRAVNSEWAHRCLPGAPFFAPPPEWATRYPPQARKTPACGHVTQYPAAVALIETLLSPVFDGTAGGQQWHPQAGSWLPRD